MQSCSRGQVRRGEEDLYTGPRLHKAERDQRDDHHARHHCDESHEDDERPRSVPFCVPFGKRIGALCLATS